MSIYEKNLYEIVSQKLNTLTIKDSQIIYKNKINEDSLKGVIVIICSNKQAIIKSNSKQ